MKLFLLPIGLGLIAASLCACSTVGAGGAGGGDWAAAAKEIATSSTCGHTDVVDIMLGVVSSGHVHLERNCPAPTPGAAPPPTPPPPK